LNREGAKLAKKNPLRERSAFPSPLRRENSGLSGPQGLLWSATATLQVHALPPGDGSFFLVREKERSSFELLAFAAFAPSRSEESFGALAVQVRRAALLPGQMRSK
jgi:hypothetical protein